ncbi:MAG TPA: asparaginase [Candidatus Limnocylindrales bacterium]|nr:asparaginase [Candidatus Limnocylindrales bacterium]
MAVIDAPSEPRKGRSAARAPRRTAAPILVRQVRNGVDESVHRGDIVEVDVRGRVIRAIGDPEVLVNLRSAVKPFGTMALLEAGGEKAFQLEPAEIAIMCASHSGEDLHVRTLQALYRRTGVSQTQLGCGAASAPLDKLTASRLARDGERPGAIRHMCSGYHTMFLLLAKLGGWPAEEYWAEDHPTQAAVRQTVAKAFRTTPARLRTGTDACGVQTFAFPLREIAWAYAVLADPGSLPGDDPRIAMRPHLETIRRVMLANPEMVGGTRARLDSSVMKALPGRVVAKGGAEALRTIGVLPGPRGSGQSATASGLALKIEDGDGFDRAGSAAFVEAIRQAGVLDGQALRVLGLYHRPPSMDPHGRVAAEAIADFELAPIGELIR